LTIRLPSLDRDFWTLASGEARHAESPESFWIPPRSARESLRVGEAAKLLFEVESEDESGRVQHDCERMWVVVAEVVPPFFIGRLTNAPIAAGSEFYLELDVEVPFLPEHVIKIDQPPADFLRALFSQPPKRFWPRD